MDEKETVQTPTTPEAETTPVETPKSEGMPKEVDTGKEDSVYEGKGKVALNAYYKQQGLSNEEAKKAVDEYVARKASEKENHAKEIASLTEKLNAANAIIKANEVEKAASSASDKLGVKKDYVSLLMREVNVDSCYVDGKLSNEKFEEAFKAVVEKYPDLKKTAENSNTFNQIGGNGQGNKTDNNKSNSIYAVKPWNRKNYGK